MTVIYGIIAYVGLVVLFCGYFVAKKLGDKYEQRQVESEISALEHSERLKDRKKLILLDSAKVANVND